MKSLLRILLFIFCGLPFLISCKQPPNDCTAIVTVIDTTGKLIEGAGVLFNIDSSSYKSNNKVIEGIPDFKFTGPDGKVTKNFTNGIVVKVEVSKDQLYGKIFMALQPGDTQEGTVKIKKRSK